MIVRVIITIISLLFLQGVGISYARTLLLDNKEICEGQKGVWREFGNDCADNCYQNTMVTNICANSITYSCDCGEKRCWYGEQGCITNKKYYQIVDQLKEQKKVAEEEQKKKDQLKQKDQKKSSDAENNNNN